MVSDTAAPDLDFEFTGSPDSTFGRFTKPADFGAGSEIHTTFTTGHAIDLNINAPGFFPPLAGGAVSFHADFNDFSSRPIFSSDALPTNTALDLGSFDVTLLPPPVRWTAAA